MKNPIRFVFYFQFLGMVACAVMFWWSSNYERDLLAGFLVIFAFTSLYQAYHFNKIWYPYKRYVEKERAADRKVETEKLAQKFSTPNASDIEKIDPVTVYARALAELAAEVKYNKKSSQELIQKTCIIEDALENSISKFQ